MSKKSIFNKIAILSVSLLVSIAAANNSAIPLMEKSFSQVPKYIIESISTLPSLCIIIFVLISTILSKKIGTKKTVLLGMLIALISGVFPMFTNNIYLILASRLLLGAGIGLFNSLAVSMISSIFKGKELAHMIGFQGSMGTIGNTVFMLIVGYVIKWGWKPTFLIYLLIIPIMLLFAFGANLPENENKDTKEKDQPSKKKSVPLSLYNYFVMIFMFGLSISIVLLKLPEYMELTEIGTAQETSIVLSIITSASIIGGLIYGFLYNKIKRFTLFLGYFIGGLGFFIISISSNLIFISIFGFISGLFLNTAGPYIFMKIGEASSGRSIKLVQAIALVAMNLGIVSSPFIWKYYGYIFKNNDAKFILRSAGIVLIAMGLYTLISEKKVKE